MLIEARSPNCWSSSYVLKRDGQPIGEFRGRAFSETQEVHLLGGRTLRCERTSLWSGELELFEHGASVSRARREGAFSRGWNLVLSCGRATLESAGLFNTAFRIVHGGREVGRVDKIGLCEGGWSVECEEPLTDVDAIFVGLVYRIILRRRAAAAAASSG